MKTENDRKLAKEIAERVARPYADRREWLIAVQAAHDAALIALGNADN